MTWDYCMKVKIISLLKFLLISWLEWYIFKSKFALSFSFLWGLSMTLEYPSKHYSKDPISAVVIKNVCKNTISNIHLAPNMADSKWWGISMVKERERLFYGNIFCTGKKGQVQTLCCNRNTIVYFALSCIYQGLSKIWNSGTMWAPKLCTKLQQKAKKCFLAFLVQ